MFILEIFIVKLVTLPILVSRPQSDSQVSGENTEWYTVKRHGSRKVYVLHLFFRMERRFSSYSRVMYFETLMGYLGLIKCISITCSTLIPTPPSVYPNTCIYESSCSFNVILNYVVDFPL